MTLVSAFLLLFLVMDPAGNVPVFLAALKPVAPGRRRLVIVRELLIALGVLVLFLFAGPTVLGALGISEQALSIAGGIILFLIALRMIFPGQGGPAGDEIEGEPFVVPLAIPLLAGPSAMASVMLVMSTDPTRWPTWLAALLLAWTTSAVILLLANRLSRFFGRRGLIAIERLMGMILTAVAVEMFMRGVAAYGG
ncbi:MAG: NAAT family transporter [Rhodothermaceae bacterium]|nr:NAAT family transporter [Rhodothermaceae bacterium]